MTTDEYAAMHALPSLGIGTGAPGLAGPPPPHTHHPERCADHGHPGRTYNRALGKTWCLCGQVVRDGDHITWPLPTQCGGALVTCNHPPHRKEGTTP